MPKILIVDDSLLNRKLLRSILEGEGYSIIEAENGLEGVKMSGEEFPDLIIMDAGMPELGGWDALDLLRSDEKTRHIPVLICSGAEYEEGLELTRKHGGQGYIVKPFMIDELQKMVKENLE